MSQNLVNAFIKFGAGGCKEDTASGSIGGSGGTGWGLSGTAVPLGLGMSILAGHVLVGKTLNSVSMFLQLSGESGTSDMNAYHWAGSDHTYGNQRAISDTRSSSAIDSSSHVEYKWTFASPAVVQAGDYISVDIPDNLGSGTNYTTQGSAFETNTKAQEFRGGWTQKTFGLRFTAEYDCPT